MLCAQCGAVMPDDAAFCMACGTPLSLLPQEQMQTPQPAQQETLLSLIDQVQHSNLAARQTPDAPQVLFEQQPALPEQQPVPAQQPPAGQAAPPQPAIFPAASPGELFPSPQPPVGSLFEPEAIRPDDAARGQPPGQQPAQQVWRQQAPPQAGAQPVREPALQPLFNEAPPPRLTATHIQKNLMAQQSQPPPQAPFIQPPPPARAPMQPAPSAPQRPQKQQKNQPPRPPFPAQAQVYEEPKPRSAGKAFITILVFFVVFLAALAGVTLGMLWFWNRPGATVDEFINAVAAGTDGSYAQLEAMRSNNKLAVHEVSPTEAQWAAFCNAFDSTGASSELKSELLQQANGEADAGGERLYGAVSVESQPLFWFINHYHVAITAVELYVPGADGGTTLWMDMQAAPGVPYENGMLYVGLMPGLYSCRLESTTGGLSAEADDIEIFGIGEPNVYEPVQAGYTVTVSNCPSDTAVLYVNGQPTAAVPAGGVVRLTGVLPGALIEIVAQVDGISMSSAITFVSPDITELVFPEAAPATDQPPEAAASSSEQPAAPAQPGPAEIDGLAASFYASYLECINQQSMAPIQGTTAAYNTELTARISSENNRPYQFQYISAQCDPESVGVFDNGARIHFNAVFQYSYRPRDTEDEYTPGTNYQTVKMVWQDGRWLVSGMSFVNENDYNSHVRVD